MRDRFFCITKQVTMCNCEVTDRQLEIIYALYMQYGEAKAAQFLASTYNIDGDAERLLSAIRQRYQWQPRKHLRKAA